MGKISRATGVSDARTGEGAPNEVEYTHEGPERVNPDVGPALARGAHPDDELRQDYAHQVTPEGRGVEVHSDHSVVTDAADGNRRRVIEHGTDDGERFEEDAEGDEQDEREPASSGERVPVPGGQVGHDPLANVPEDDPARNANRDEGGSDDSYASMSYAELQADCKTRTPALSSKGDREALIARLREDDQRRARDEDDETP